MSDRDDVEGKPAMPALPLIPRLSADGRRSRVTLDIDPQGDVFLKSHVTGEGLQAAWGAEDEEITVRVPAQAAAQLALAGLHRLLDGRPDAARTLMSLCKAENIP